MKTLSRRGVLKGTLGVSVTALLARPYIANAQAKTATVWFQQGFVRQEDEALRKTIAAYEKISGNKIDYSIMPFRALNQKAISALTSGDVPDLIFHDAPTAILPQNAWHNRLEDMSDVVATQESKYSESALLSASFYNGTTKKRSYYMAPVKQNSAPFHIWSDLVEKAGFKMSDIPERWDDRWKFFKPVHEALRKQGMRRTFGIGLQVTTVGPNDGNNLFYHYVIANGGEGMVTKDGKLHTADPKVREAAIHSVEFMTDLYKGGYVPPEALSWNDADDNNAYHSKLFVMDFDGTLSTELAQITKDPKGYHEQMKILNVGKKNDGSQMLCQVGAGGGFVPRGAKNVAVAKDFMTYFIQPKVMNENLKNGLGRWVPAIPQVVKDDPWWTDPKLDPFRAIYTQQTVLEPTIPNWIGYNPALGQVNAEQVWGQCHADVIKSGMSPKEAVDKAFNRASEIFEKFSFG